MKKLSIIAALAFGTSALNAQVVYDYLKSADAYFAKGDYNSAAAYYEKYLDVKNGKVKADAYDPYTVKSLSAQQKIAVSNRQQAVYKLAESYRLLSYPAKAEPWYAQAEKFDRQQFPLSAYWHGKTLRALGKYDDADSALYRFDTGYVASDLYKEDAQREIKNLRFIQEQLKKDTKLFTVGKAASLLNTNGASSAPVWINKNTLAFTSTRLDSGNQKKEYTNKVYLASYSDGVVSSVQKTELAQPAGTHQGIVSFTPDGKTVYLTRWVMGKGTKSSSMYISKNENGTWTAPQLLDSTINTGNTQEPFIMPDSRNLVFSSDRAGGFGGFDLWSVALDAAGNIAGQPVNLGSTINTKYDERAPYYHQPTGSLVFSSNGNVGMGGFDFFQSKGTIGAWSAPINMGYPLNSIKDDIYFASKGSAKNILGDVIFSSDRESACCLEMFSLSKLRPIKQLAGIVVDCETKQPISNATVEVTAIATGKVVANKQSGADGGYNFTQEDFDAYSATATAPGYYSGKAETAMITDDDQVSQKLSIICLNKIPPPPPPPPPVDTIVVMNNIYFDFNKASILPESFQYIDAEILSMLNKYPTMVIEIGGHTDSKGNDEYNQKLSEARANAVKQYLVSKGVAAERMEVKGYGESKPVEANEIDGKDNPEGRKKNRRTEFKVLHY